MISFATVCSGIEAPSIALGSHGWRAEWFAEIEPFPCALLAHHYPNTPNHGDMTLMPQMVAEGTASAPDVLIGGTPCQAFSVAGQRLGLDDERGKLTIKFVELANANDIVRESADKQPSVIWWENVPGVLSDKDNAFGCFLGALAGSGCELQPAGGGKSWPDAGAVYGPQRAVAWRVLDAQYFGLAQRRKRVFVVSSARDGFDPAKVLFEFDGVRRDIAPSRETGKETAGDVGAGTKTASHWDGIENPHPTLSQSHNTGGIGASNQELFSQRGAGLVAHGYRMVAFGEYADDQTASTMKARDHKDATDLVCSIHGTQDPIVGHERAHALGCNGGKENALVFQPRYYADRKNCGGAPSWAAPTLLASSGTGDASNHVLSGLNVRRLTPVEHERLMGFPDSYTQIPWRDKPATECPDGHRYKALGNSMAVPCMSWLGRRIEEVLCSSAKAAN